MLLLVYPSYPIAFLSNSKCSSAASYNFMSNWLCSIIFFVVSSSGCFATGMCIIRLVTLSTQHPLFWGDRLVCSMEQVSLLLSKCSANQGRRFTNKVSVASICSVIPTKVNLDFILAMALFTRSSSVASDGKSWETRFRTCLSLRWDMQRLSYPGQLPLSNSV